MKFQSVEMSKQLVVGHLVIFQMVWKRCAHFVFAVKTETSYFDKTTSCFYENLNRKIISIDCFGKQIVIFITKFC